jgi:hypothetical protein
MRQLDTTVVLVSGVPLVFGLVTVSWSVGAVDVLRVGVAVAVAAVAEGVAVVIWRFWMSALLFREKPKSHYSWNIELGEEEGENIHTVRETVMSTVIILVLGRTTVLKVLLIVLSLSIALLDSSSATRSLADTTALDLIQSCLSLLAGSVTEVAALIIILVLVDRGLLGSALGGTLAWGGLWSSTVLF